MNQIHGKKQKTIIDLHLTRVVLTSVKHLVDLNPITNYPRAKRNNELTDKIIQVINIQQIYIHNYVPSSSQRKIYTVS